MTRHGLLRHFVVKREQIVDLLLQIRLRGRRNELSLNVCKRIGLGERISFDGGARQNPSRQEDAGQLSCNRWPQRNARKMLALRLTLTEKAPQSRRSFSQIQAKRQPGMRVEILSRSMSKQIAIVRVSRNVHHNVSISKSRMKSKNDPVKRKK